MGLTALSTIVVFAYQWFVVTQLGAGSGTDALFAGMVVPQLVLNVISGSLAFVLVPMLSVTDEKTNSSAVWSFAIALAAVFGVLAVILWLLAPWWVPLTVPGFDALAMSQTVTLTRIQLLGMFFSGLGAPFNAAYQAQNRFVHPALMSVIAGFLALIFVVGLLEAGGVEIAAWGLTLRSSLQFVLQVPIGFPFSRPNFGNSRFLDSLRKLRPLIAGTIYYKTDQLLDRFLASMAPTGSVSLLHLAQQIYAGANLILVNAIAAPAVPRMSTHSSNGDMHLLRRDIMRTLMVLMGLGLAIFAMIVYPGRYLLLFLFAHGNLKESAITELWMIMLALGLVWFSGLTGQVFSSGFYSMSDTTTPTRIGVVGFSLGIVLKIAGFLFYGVIGIAIATGIYMTFNSIAMYIILFRRLAAKPSLLKGEPR